MNDSKKLVLLTNDDGIHASGLFILRQHLLQFCDVIVVAPAEECSASSHAVTLRQSLSVETYQKDGEWIGYAVSGKPADCVKLALCELMKKKPDYIISGINNGPNLGVSIFYSGTVAAAREGAITGIPSMAFSVTSHEVPDFEPAAFWSIQIFREIMKLDVPQKTYLNVNIPHLPNDRIQGIKVTKQADSFYEEQFTKGSFSTKEKSEYFLGGELLVAAEHGDNDVEVVESGFISVTPLKLDLTDEDYRRELQDKF